MNIRVGLMEGRSRISVDLDGRFVDEAGHVLAPGPHEFGQPVRLSPSNPGGDRFLVPDVTIGIGFHWERRQAQSFTGGLTIEPDSAGLTLVNEVPIEDYVSSVIASEMSSRSPIEFLKAHAVISRSWVAAQIGATGGGTHRRETRSEKGEPEIVAWYGREAHDLFDVCADDHCQRYQGASRSDSGAVRQAVEATAGEFLTSSGSVCDARFSKCCGGITEAFDAAWDDRDVSYLRPVHDGPGPVPAVDDAWFGSRPEAWCNTSDPEILSRILPGFDQETTDFFRWTLAYVPDELGGIVAGRTGVEIGPVVGLEPLARGRSGRIVRLRIKGRSGSLVVGKELEIRRVLSTSHLYSSAFAAEVSPEVIVFRGAGWGHGVGLCQIGAGAQASAGKGYREILAHYYPGTDVGRGPGFQLGDL